MRPLNEEWLTISGFPNYSVSSLGNIRSDVASCKRPVPGSLLKPRAGVKGHLYVNLYKDKKATSFYVHRAVLIAFSGEPSPEKPCVGHRDGNPSNNRLDNLRWVSYAENSQDSILHGTSGRPGGERHFRAKLNADVISSAKELVRQGKSMRSIAKTFGVSHPTISAAINGRSYKNAAMV